MHFGKRPNKSDNRARVEKEKRNRNLIKNINNRGKKTFKTANRNDRIHNQSMVFWSLIGLARGERTSALQAENYSKQQSNKYWRDIKILTITKF